MAFLFKIMVSVGVKTAFTQSRAFMSGTFFTSDPHGPNQKLIRDIIEAMEYMVKSKNVTPEISDDAERPDEAFHADNHIQNECMRQYGSFKK